jgi:hypothetical protein
VINVGELRRAIGNAPKNAGIVGLNCLTYTPHRAAPPMWYPGEVTFDRTASGHRTFGDTRSYIVQGTVITAAESDAQAGQDLLDEYLSEGSQKSIIDAIEADTTLGQLCDDLNVESVDGYRLYTFGQAVFFGARLRIFVIG